MSLFVELCLIKKRIVFDYDCINFTYIYRFLRRILIAEGGRLLTADNLTERAVEDYQQLPP